MTMRKLLVATFALACSLAAAQAQQAPTYNVGNFPAVQAVSQSGAWTFGLTGPIPAGSNAIGTVGVTALPPLPAGTNSIGTIGNAFALDSTIQARLGTLGQKPMSGSTPVVLASDQSALPISAASLPLPTGAATAANQPTPVTGGFPFDVSNVGTQVQAYALNGEPGYSDNRMWPLSMTTWGGLRTASVETGSANAAAGIVPATANAVTALVAKPSAGNLYGAYALNLSTSAGFLVTVNATAAPASGAAISAVDCRPLPASSAAEFGHGPGPADYYPSGIVILASTSCTTYTPGALSAYVKARVR